MRRTKDEDGAYYRIGAVAQLTGLPANTIRTWERRYDAVRPSRSEAGGRLYSEADVERLQVLKSLSDRGDAISSTSALSTPELQQRLARREPSSPESSQSASIRAAVLHRTLGLTLDQSGDPRWTVVASKLSVDALVEAASEEPADVLILEMALLGEVVEAAYERCVEAWSPRAVIVLFNFARRRVLEQLADAGARLIRSPVDAPWLFRIVREQLDVMAGPNVPPPLPSPPTFNDHQLVKLRQIQSTVECECPHHLAAIVETLIAFERYSASCESSNEQDAEVHRTLQFGTAQARLRMEELLKRVIAWEEIEV